MGYRSRFGVPGADIFRQAIDLRKRFTPFAVSTLREFDCYQKESENSYDSD